MKPIRRSWALAAMGLAGVAGGIALGAGIAGAPGDTPDKASIEAVVRDYILAHPEIIPEAMERLQSRKEAIAIASDRKAIETPFAGAWAGNPKGDVTLVMFSDYNCPYCRASVPDIDKLLAADPKLKVVWREIPVLGPPSEAAARAALAAAMQGGYQPFHHAVFAAGRVDPARLAAAGKAAGLDPARLTADAKGADVAHELESNIAIASRLGVSGTPAFIVGNRMLSGAVGHDALLQAIADARKG